MLFDFNYGLIVLNKNITLNEEFFLINFRISFVVNHIET